MASSVNDAMMGRTESLFLERIIDQATLLVNSDLRPSSGVAIDPSSPCQPNLPLSSFLRRCILPAALTVSTPCELLGDTLILTGLAADDWKTANKALQQNRDAVLRY